ncbi:WD40-repeat-containing domain protein [Dioszegia hungarica]|uniref:WD40-repeat-containing domain protein n=1 Tax=Dioszegia hungarica TaxID=4972 RepID=A0AA38LT95_9TREE|nr:WD40-repeat-containing domain protein [Dioszegia hungarica]KAI9634438.1 WD40-repeat-containing domain protein [Dioszegia hungarica]
MSNQAGPSRHPAGPPPSRQPISLEPYVLDKLAPARLFKDAINGKLPWVSTAHHGYSTKAQISSIAFDDTGNGCVTAGEDELFNWWDITTGTKKKTYASHKYGLSQIRLTHKPTNVLHTSTKTNHDIRYHSMHDNKYLLYLKGHSARVRSIQMHPTEDRFISGGDDGTVRIWDLRQGKCQALLNNVGGSTIAAFDHAGTIFAVASSDLGVVMLYGTDAPDAIPFSHARLVDPELERASQPPRRPVFTSISFSNAGDLILIGTSSDVHYVVDGYDLSIHCRLVGHQGLETDRNGRREPQPRRGGSGEEVGWTADSRWVYSGSADGSVYFWDMASHQRPSDDAKLKAGGRIPYKTLTPTIRKKPEMFAEMGPSRAVRFNPRHAMMAVGGEQLAFMLPEREEKAPEGW